MKVQKQTAKGTSKRQGQGSGGKKTVGEREKLKRKREKKV